MAKFYGTAEEAATLAIAFPSGGVECDRQQERDDNGSDALDVEALAVMLVEVATNGLRQEGGAA